MRTNEERIRLIHKRTAELKQEKRQKRERILDGISIAVCLLLIVAVGAFMPEVMASMAEGGVSHASGAASLIGNHAALGYILMGLLSFLLGVCVTVLLYRLKHREEYKEDEDGEL